MKWYNFNTSAPREGQKVLLRFRAQTKDENNVKDIPREYVVGKYDNDWSRFTQMAFWDLGEMSFRWTENYFDAWSPMPELDDEPVDFVS